MVDTFIGHLCQTQYVISINNDNIKIYEFIFPRHIKIYLDCSHTPQRLGKTRSWLATIDGAGMFQSDFFKVINQCSLFFMM